MAIPKPAPQGPSVWVGLALSSYCLATDTKASRRAVSLPCWTSLLPPTSATPSVRCWGWNPSRALRLPNPKPRPKAPRVHLPGGRAPNWVLSPRRKASPVPKAPGRAPQAPKPLLWPQGQLPHSYWDSLPSKRGAPRLRARGSPYRRLGASTQQQTNKEATWTDGEFPNTDKAEKVHWAGTMRGPLCAASSQSAPHQTALVHGTQPSGLSWCHVTRVPGPTSMFPRG